MSSIFHAGENDCSWNAIADTCFVLSDEQQGRIQRGGSMQATRLRLQQASSWQLQLAALRLTAVSIYNIMKAAIPEAAA